VTFQQSEQFTRRLADTAVWLTTVSAKNRPAPRPVWFVYDREQIIVFSRPDAVKVKHIENNPYVSLSFNTTDEGLDVLVISGNAEIDRTLVPSTAPGGYLTKYEPRYATIGLTRETFDQTYSLGIRITPTRSWSYV
jgi:PPOX class probable F420-dependent enzyme